MDIRRLRLDIPGAAHQVLPDDVRLLDPEEAVFAAMLRGWITQQESRYLKQESIKGRVRYVQRLQKFSNLYPWQWRPATLEDFTSAEFRSKNRARSTARGMQNAIGVFQEYVTDPRYDWPPICLHNFGESPVQICTELNMLTHDSDYEGDPERRPFTHAELQDFFDYIDDQYERVRLRGRKGSLALLRDGTIFKTIVGWGLRRNEARQLAIHDLRRNPSIPEYGNYGVIVVRHGKSKRGGPPRRREVFSMPHFDWAIDALKFYCDQVRPLFRPGKHPALFISERHGYLKARSIGDRFDEFRKGAGLPEELTMHCLRHYYTTYLAEANVDALLIQDQLGHSWASTTGIYTHVSRDFKLKTLKALYSDYYVRTQ